MCRGATLAATGPAALLLLLLLLLCTILLGWQRLPTLGSAAAAAASTRVVVAVFCRLQCVQSEPCDARGMRRAGVVQMQHC